MQFDISHTPFSKYGSYLSVSTDERNPTAHLLIRNARKKWGEERLFDLVFQRDGQPVPVRVTATPSVVTVQAEGGTARIYLRQDTELVIECRGLDVLMQLARPQHGFGVDVDERAYLFIDHIGELYVTTTILRGAATTVRTPDDDVERCPIRGLQVRGVDGTALIHLNAQPYQQETPAPAPEIDADIAAVQAEWDAFAAGMPAVPASRRESAELAWYNIWSCVVRAGGLLAYDAVLMSKRGMSAVWTWDHCFNALALGTVDFETGLQQLLLPFELQRSTGQLPDRWTATESTWTITKPPIHGWTLHKLLEGREVAPAMLQKLYDHLARFTDWWFTYRDTDGDGIPNYYHGCDSGWDNSTLFDIGYGLESPDLPAFLFLQMRTLADLALRLGQEDEAKGWLARAETLLQRLYAHSWDGEGFIATLSRSHAHEERPTSLLALMPLVLGEYLAPEKFARLVERLERDFLTPYGPATEMPSSPKYNPDGYWRGPIWAPSTYLIVDGLARGGRPDLAAEIARRFCDLCEVAGGNYENFDALTGQGLRDQAYTWTASVNLLLMHEYLLPAG